MDENKTVLTVDDDSSVRVLIKAALAGNRAIRVIEASDGASGMVAAKKHQPDLVILDVMMPIQDGLATLSQLRSDPGFSKTPVLMLTGVKDDDKLDQIRRHRDTDFMPKPFVIENLRRRVNTLLFQNA